MWGGGYSTVRYFAIPLIMHACLKGNSYICDVCTACFCFWIPAQKEEFQHTAYSTNAYLLPGRYASRLLQGLRRAIAFALPGYSSVLLYVQTNSHNEHTRNCVRSLWLVKICFMCRSLFMSKACPCCGAFNTVVQE